MQPRSLFDLLNYLRGLAQRHHGVVTALVAPAGAFPDLGAAQHPAVFVEPDPLMEQVNEGADAYTFGLHFLTKQARADERAIPELVSQMKQLADEYGQQLLREQQVVLHRPPTAVVLWEADSSLSSGVRWEITLLVPKTIDRATNVALFDPL